MKLTDIIAEADARVPNAASTANKVTWLNEVNNEFFDIVKIPLSSTFSATPGTAGYTLTPTDIRSKNIDRLMVGTSVYRNFNYEDVNPAENYFLFNDSSNQLTLSPAPLMAGTGVLRYHRIATTTFVSSDLTVEPDAPSEYHWIYVLGLCERIAKAMHDDVMGNNYAQDYQKNLLIAQQNYKKG